MKLKSSSSAKQQSSQTSRSKVAKQIKAKPQSHAKQSKIVKQPKRSSRAKQQSSKPKQQSKAKQCKAKQIDATKQLAKHSTTKQGKVPNAELRSRGKQVKEEPSSEAATIDCACSMYTGRWREPLAGVWIMHVYTHVCLCMKRCMHGLTGRVTGYTISPEIIAHN